MHTSLRLLEGISLVKRSCNGYTKGLVSYGGNRRIFRLQGDPVTIQVKVDPVPNVSGDLNVFVGAEGSTPARHGRILRRPHRGTGDRDAVSLRLRQEAQAALRRGDGELSPGKPFHGIR
jgi:hypothetical protein